MARKGGLRLLVHSCVMIVSLPLARRARPDALERYMMLKKEEDEWEEKVRSGWFQWADPGTKCCVFDCSTLGW